MFPFPNPQTGGGRFDPRQLGGLLGAWWDSTDNTLLSMSGSNVATYTDKKNGIALTPATGNVTLSTLNSVQVLNFGGAAALTLASLPGSLPISTDEPDVFWAGLDNGTGTGFAPSVIGWAGWGFGYYGTSQGSTGLQTVSGGSFKTTSNGASGTAVISMHEDLSASTSQFWANGTARTMTSQSVWAPPGTATVDMGQRPGGAEYVNAKIGDVIIAKNLSTFQRQQVEGYLAWKFGLQGSLPGGHPYATSPP